MRELEVQARDGRWYSVRIRPYQTADNRVDGAVISFVDIDALKRGLELAKAARDQAQAIIATVRQPLVILDADLRIVMANRSFYAVFQVAPEATEHRSIFELGNRQWDIPQSRKQLEEVLPRDSASENVEVEHRDSRPGHCRGRRHARRDHRHLEPPTLRSSLRASRRAGKPRCDASVVSTSGATSRRAATVSNR